jgi:signal transduction histidine kinase
VVPLLAFGLGLILFALVPGIRRLPVLIVLAGMIAALIAWTITSDAFLIAAAGLVPLLVGLLALEISDTLSLVSRPSREARRARLVEQRERDRRREQHERERARRRRERERDRLAA